MPIMPVDEHTRDEPVARRCRRPLRLDDNRGSLVPPGQKPPQGSANAETVLSVDLGFSQINEGTMQDGVPNFSPQEFIGFLHETCFYDILNHVNETLIPAEIMVLTKAAEKSFKLSPER